MASYGVTCSTGRAPLTSRTINVVRQARRDRRRSGREPGCTCTYPDTGPGARLRHRQRHHPIPRGPLNGLRQPVRHRVPAADRRGLRQRTTPLASDHRLASSPRGSHHCRRRYAQLTGSTAPWGSAVSPVTGEVLTSVTRTRPRSSCTRRRPPVTAVAPAQWARDGRDRRDDHRGEPGRGDGCVPSVECRGDDRGARRVSTTVDGGGSRRTRRARSTVTVTWGGQTSRGCRCLHVHGGGAGQGDRGAAGARATGR